MYLSVVCGSVGIFTVEIELTQAEIASFNAIGRTFIDELASGISFPQTPIYIGNQTLEMSLIYLLL